MDKDLISSLREDLLQNVDVKTRDGAQRFFKEEVRVYGLKTAVVNSLAVKYFKQVKGFPKSQIFVLCEELLRSDYSEEAYIAFDWAFRLADQYQPSDFDVFESWIKRYVNNWAKCDVLCNHTLGAFIEKYPGYIKELKRWTKSDNRWMRRAAAATLILPARRGKYLKDIFEIADSLLPDKDDLVQKGYGWLLKEASRVHEQEVFAYVQKHKALMPRTALRYAIEKMPADLKKQAMSRE
jgi:3-methyladenine DNA glycosylase AlkD